MELGGPEDGPRNRRAFDEPLGVQLLPVVGERHAFESDNGDADEVGDPRASRDLEETLGAFHGRTARLAGGTLHGMNYRARAAHRCLYALSGEQISFDGAGPAAPAHHPRLHTLGAQPIHNPPAEPPRAAGDQHVSRFHDKDLLLLYLLRVDHRMDGGLKSVVDFGVVPLC
jgi:hypothetical protein